MNEQAIIELPQESFSRREERELPALVPSANVNVTPLQLLNIAVSKGTDLAQLEKLMDLQERWEKNEARKAYAEALAAFKANPPTVYKDKENKQYDSMYTTKGNLVNTINPELSKYGLSVRWDFDQIGGIKVTCILTHRAGHSESVSMSGPADDSGKKNPLQQIKSTVTYLEIATFEAVTGTASADGSADDDGNSSGETKKRETGPPPWTDADFQADFPRFESLIKAGKNTAEKIITMVSSKVLPSDAQKAAIRAVKVIPVDAAFVKEMEDAE